MENVNSGGNSGSHENEDETQKELRLRLRVHIACDACGQSNPAMRCARCQLVYYCGRECQRRHWTEHRPDCRSVDWMREACSRVGAALPAASTSRDLSTALNTECGICLEERMPDPVVLNECRHAFCFSCLKDWQTYANNASSMASAAPSSSSSCPYCRQQIQVNLLEDCSEKAKLYAARARKKSIPAEERTKFYNLALENVNKALAGANAKRDLENLCLKGQILTAQGQNPEEAIECYEKALALDAKGFAKREQINALLDSVEEAQEAGDFDEAERRMDVVEDFQTANPFLFQIGEGPTRLYLLKILLAEAHEAAEQWKAARDLYIQLLSAIDDPTTVSPSQTRMIFSGIARCAYRLGGDDEYERAEKAAECALSMNRHFQGVHKLIALPQRELGRLSEAIATMSRAVLYEAPWDDENARENVALLEELERQAEAAEL